MEVVELHKWLQQACLSNNNNREKKGEVNLLIDTGAEVSLIKNLYLYLHEIKQNVKFWICKVGPVALKTLGIEYLNINEVRNDLCIIFPDFQFPGNECQVVTSAVSWNESYFTLLDEGG